MNRDEYIKGSAVRKLSPSPKRQNPGKSSQELEEIRRRKSRRNAARRNRERNMAMGVGYACFLCVCSVVCAAVCFFWITTQSHNSHLKKQVMQMQNQVSDLQMENNQKYKNITTSMDINHVKEVAIYELGMDYPSEEQVVYYSVEKNNYMDQFADIPE